MLSELCCAIDGSEAFSEAGAFSTEGGETAHAARDLRAPAMLEGLIYLVINVVVVGLVIWLLRFLIELNPLGGPLATSRKRRGGGDGCPDNRHVAHELRGQASRSLTLAWPSALPVRYIVLMAFPGRMLCEPFARLDRDRRH